MARLDRLGSAKEVAQIGAVIGRKRGIQFVEFHTLSVGVGKSSGALHLANDRKVCAVGVLRRAKISEQSVRFGCKVFQ
jgi:hypothetical protein